MHYRLVVGRIAWTEDNQYQTPWVSFRNITEYRRWCAAMRKEIARSKGLNPRKLKSDYHYVDCVWSAEGLLRKVQQDPGQEVA